MNIPDRISNLIRYLIYIGFIIFCCLSLMLSIKALKQSEKKTLNLDSQESDVDYRIYYEKMDEIAMIKFLQKDSYTKVYTIRKSGAVSILGFVEGKINSVDELVKAKFRDYKWVSEGLVVLDSLSVCDTKPADYEPKPILDVSDIQVDKPFLTYCEKDDYTYLISKSKSGMPCVLLANRGKVEDIASLKEEDTYFTYDRITFKRSRRILCMD